MNIAYEFSKVKEAFEKVKADTTFLAKKITDNYETFMREHYKLASKVDALSGEIKSHMQYVKDNHTKEDSKPSSKELQDLKYIVKELRSDVKETQMQHGKVMERIEELKKEKKSDNSLEKKFENTELELHLMKKKLEEKDEEMKQVKEVTSHLYNLVDELAQLELDLMKKVESK